MYICIVFIQTYLIMLYLCVDHHEGPVPDAEEDASVPEGAEQGQSNHTYLPVCVCVLINH